MSFFMYDYLNQLFILPLWQSYHTSYLLSVDYFIYIQVVKIKWLLY